MNQGVETDLIMSLPVLKLFLRVDAAKSDKRVTTHPQVYRRH